MYYLHMILFSDFLAVYLSSRIFLSSKHMQKSEEPFLTLTLWDVIPLESPPHPELKNFFTLCITKLIQDISEHIQFISAYGQLSFCNTDLKNILYVSFLEGTTLYITFMISYALLYHYNNSARCILFLSFLMRKFMVQESYCQLITLIG